MVCLQKVRTFLPGFSDYMLRPGNLQPIWFKLRGEKSKQHL